MIQRFSQGSVAFIPPRMVRSRSGRDPDDYTTLHAGGGVNLRVTYKGDKTCELRHPSGARITTDAPLDNDGKGSAFSPTDLVAASVAACAQTVIAIRAKALGVQLGERSIVMQVTKQMSEDAPRRIARLPITAFFNVDLSQPQKESMVRIIKECPVRQSLHPSIKIPMALVWADGTVSRVDLDGGHH